MASPSSVVGFGFSSNTLIRAELFIMNVYSSKCWGKLCVFQVYWLASDIKIEYIELIFSFLLFSGVQSLCFKGSLHFVWLPSQEANCTADSLLTLSYWLEWTIWWRYVTLPSGNSAIKHKRRMLQGMWGVCCLFTQLLDCSYLTGWKEQLQASSQSRIQCCPNRAKEPTTTYQLPGEQCILSITC